MCSHGRSAKISNLDTSQKDTKNLKEGLKFDIVIDNDNIHKTNIDLFNSRISIIFIIAQSLK